jgi:hypothetical protein
MVPSSAIIVVADDERLTCGRFSLGEPICLGNFESIADYFGGLSLSPTVAMTEDSAEEFLTTTPRTKSAPVVQATMMVPPWMVAPRAKAGLPFERRHAHHRGQQVQACARQPIAEQEAVPRRSKLVDE